MGVRSTLAEPSAVGGRCPRKGEDRGAEQSRAWLNASVRGAARRLRRPGEYLRTLTIDSCILTPRRRRRRSLDVDDEAHLPTRCPCQYYDHDMYE